MGLNLIPVVAPCHAIFDPANEFAGELGLTWGDWTSRLRCRLLERSRRGVRQAGGAMILWGGVRRLAFRLAPLSAILLLSGCDLGVLDPKGPIGDANLQILIDSVAIMLAIVVPTVIATLVVAWWFRSSNTRAQYLPDFEYSGSLELIVWAIPLLTILLLGGVAWVGSHDLDPAKPIEVDRGAAQRSGRVARLEVAVHLPRSARRQRQSPGDPRRRSDPLFADLGKRDDRFLHPSARQHDLHHEPHAHAALPRSR